MIIVLSGGLLGALGLGWLVVGPLLYGHLWRSRQNVPVLSELALTLVWGLILAYGLVVLLQSLSLSLVIGGLLALLGLGCFSLHIVKNPQRRPQLHSESRNKWIGIIVISLIYLPAILAQPLSAWDARTIWFFHARMIYLAGSFGESAGWLHPSLSWSHLDYPNFVPVLAALVTYAKGYWNEYLPKAALFLVLFPALIWLFTFARRSIGFTVLLMLVPFSFGEWLWDGYMDGYLAFYTLLAMLFIGRYRLTSQRIDLLSAFTCLILLSYFKNEGLLVTLIGLGALLVVILIQSVRLHFQAKAFLKTYWSSGLAILIGLLPFALWSFQKQSWQLTNDLQLGSSAAWARLLGRLADGSYQLILQRSFMQIAGALLLLGFAYVVMKVNKKSTLGEGWPALGVAAIYLAGMSVVYLMTPYDLVWHLDTSLERTLLPVSSCLYGASFFILSALDGNQTENAGQSEIAPAEAGA